MTNDKFFLLSPQPVVMQFEISVLLGVLCVVVGKKAKKSSPRSTENTEKHRETETEPVPLPTESRTELCATSEPSRTVA